MQYIDVNAPKIVSARNHHYLILRYVILKKLLGDTFKEDTPIAGLRPKKVNGLSEKLINYLSNESNLKDILVGTPDVLEKIKSKFYKEKEYIGKIFDYDKWSSIANRSYSAYNLAERLDIPTCTYCNRNYTKTVTTEAGKKVTRPAFDHWFPKGKFPILALSFYNLIPSCNVCNSGLKGAKPFDLQTYFHPYYLDPANQVDLQFSYDYKNYSSFAFKIVTSNQISKNSVDAFELEEIYKAHEDEIKELLEIKNAYSESYLEMLEKQVLNGVSLDRKEVYRLAFGVHFEEAQFDRRPLSKMKKDILTELGII